MPAMSTGRWQAMNYAPAIVITMPAGRQARVANGAGGMAGCDCQGGKCSAVIIMFKYVIDKLTFVIRM